MLSKIERIAQLLVKLQESGYVDYTHFHMVCGCSEYKRNEFDAAIDSMENALDKWKKSVEKCRKEYPHLNYYISQQLLDLQQELGQLHKHPNSLPSHKLKQLLLSVTPEPLHSKIVTALNNAKKAISRNQMTASTGIKIATTHSATAPKAASSIVAVDPSTFDDEQKEIYKTLTREDDFKVSVVLAAFYELGEDAEEDDLRDWCTNNEHKFKDEDDIVLPSIDTAIDEEENEAVNADDPIVIELLDEDYSISIAIEAVQLAKGDSQKAREIASALYVGKSIKPHSNTEESEWYE